MIARAQILAVLVATSAVVAVVGTTYGAFSGTTTNANNTFQAASSFCTALAPLWMTGFEHGFVSAAGSPDGQFDSISHAGGAIAIDNSTIRSGENSLRIPDTNVLGASNAQITFSPDAPSTVVARFAVLLDSLPGNVTLAFVAAGTNVVFGYNGLGRFRLTSGLTTVTSTNTVSAGTWYVIDLRANFGANPNTVDWQINGVAQTSLSSGVAASTAAGIGWGSTSIVESFTANYDDILVSLSGGDYPFGDGRILRLSPNANTVPVTNFQDDDSTPIDASSWARIDDSPMTDTVDYIKQIATDSTGFVQLEFNNPGDCVKALFATVAFANGSTSANSGKTSIFDGATERVVYTGSMSSSALTYRMTRIDPASPPWSQNAINGLVARIGYSTDVSPEPRWQALALEYETDP